MTPFIVHGKYDNTLIKEDGVWRWKKFHWNVIFRSPLHAGWVDVPIHGGMKGLDEMFPPDAPTTSYEPYNPNVSNKFDPAPPEPYK
jgi:hypothetical protein